MPDHFNVRALLKSRCDQKSFHAASEAHVRVEFWNLSTGEVVPTFRYGGNVVLLCFAGAFAVKHAAEELVLRELDQLVVPADTSLDIRCVESGSLELIWAPPFAENRAASSSGT